jgi:gamma-glutamyltranspeptidase
MSANPQAEALRRALRDASVALDAAEVSGEPAALSQALAQMSRCHRRFGSLAEAVWYAEDGLRIARSLSAVDASVDALCELAELAFEQIGGARRPGRSAWRTPSAGHRP